MADAALKPMTREEFLAWDERQPDRYEFIGGQVHAMTGGSRDHARIARNIGRSLETALRGTRCHVYGNDLRVAAANDYTYPDVVVTCEAMGPKELFIRHPRLIVEVLSPSTIAYDRGDKWMAYQTVPTLEYYLLVSQDEPRIEVFAKRDGSWTYQAYIGLATNVPLRTFDTELALSAAYENCFEPDAGAEQAG